MRLAKAAAQRLKAVIVESDAVCGRIRIGDTAVYTKKLIKEKATDAKATAPKDPVLVNDIHSLVTNLRGKSDGQSNSIIDGLSDVVAALPEQLLRKITGGDIPPVNKNRQREIVEIVSQSNKKQEESSIRAKYLDKINKLKQKKSTGSNEKTTEGVTGWVSKCGLQDFMSYVSTRGLMIGIIPPRELPQSSDVGDYFLFEKEFDAVMPRDDMAQIPKADPIIRLCKAMEIETFEVAVLAQSASALSAARSAGTHCCQLLETDTQPHSYHAHYHISKLVDFRYIVEELNGISYR
ncbi:hypothetical protein ABG067_005212 [Albugo candida]